ncbi:MAG: DUF1598 domain-containing protein [Pirellulales bacterium]|nr:DUF1598 domain-containing protein [Pirellulales bacterium]
MSLTMRGLLVVCGLWVFGLSPALSYGQMPGMPASPEGLGGPSLTGAGVVVDADGVLRMQQNPDKTGTLTRQRMQAAKAALDPKVAKKSPLRKISLNRLEAALKARLDNGQKPTEDMQFLAGLTRVQYVFFIPETNDVILAGPAEGYVTNLVGRTQGLESGRPVLQLEDLVVALRAFFNDHNNPAPLIGCSIDPTKEGLANMQAFLRNMGSRATPNQTQFITNGLKESLGLQVVKLVGIPAKSHFAQVLVEADYRMKLLGIGLEPIPVKGMQSYAARANPAAISKNALARWYFVPDYQCVKVAEDDLAMELVGDGVKLVGADELVQADGTRAKSAAVDLASKGFTTDFTKNYAKIANQISVYWQMRNLIDLTVAVAFIKDRGYAEKAGWNMSTFLSEKDYSVETQNVPAQVETAVAAFWKGNRLVTPIGGGVHIEPAEAIKSANMQNDKDGTVAKARESINVKDLPADQWWWD